MKLRAYLVDDEELAIKRLARLLDESGRVEIIGSSSDPLHARDEVQELAPDVLFLDIEMPEMSGFELLTGLAEQPLVVFTTAYNQYALKAFEVNSIDYLLKPIEPPQLERALNKLERIVRGGEAKPELSAIMQQLASVLKGKQTPYPERLASKLGERVEFVELD